ncbi:hypothetical protein [Paenibacillus silvisoli]|uniref:hypothetical protein n=1 Tax=Paenibacillus silvisoli TaxID=3110539 RepID=UPI002804BF30|nr:hypothetical protein [Paenibacillus silvisoli]
MVRLAEMGWSGGEVYVRDWAVFDEKQVGWLYPHRPSAAAQDRLMLAAPERAYAAWPELKAEACQASPQEGANRECC